METGSNGAKSSTEVEVVTKAERRRFTAEYKLKVLREAEDCQRPGEIGALLRREGLYWSNLTHWRKQRERGELAGLTAKRRGRLPAIEARSVHTYRLSGKKPANRQRLKPSLSKPFLLSIYGDAILS